MKRTLIITHWIQVNLKIWDCRSVGSVNTHLCAKLRCAALRIKKALGIFRELITTRRTKLAFWDPPSGSKNKQQRTKEGKPCTDKRSSRSRSRSRCQVCWQCYLVPVVVYCNLLVAACCRFSPQCVVHSSRRSTADRRRWTDPCHPLSNVEQSRRDLSALHGKILQPLLFHGRSRTAYLYRCVCSGITGR